MDKRRNPPSFSRPPGVAMGEPISGKHDNQHVVSSCFGNRNAVPIQLRNGVDPAEWLIQLDAHTVLNSLRDIECHKKLGRVSQ